MRIERLQQADDRAVDQSIGLHFTEVVVFHRVQRGSEDLVLIGDRILRSERGASEEGGREPAYHYRADGDRQGAMSAHEDGPFPVLRVEWPRGDGPYVSFLVPGAAARRFLIWSQSSSRRLSSFSKPRSVGR